MSLALMMESAIQHPPQTSQIKLSSTYLEISEYDLCKALMFEVIEEKANEAIAYDQDAISYSRSENQDLTYLGQINWERRLISLFDDSSIDPFLEWFVSMGILKLKTIDDGVYYWTCLPKIQAMLDQLE